MSTAVGTMDLPWIRRNAASPRYRGRWIAVTHSLPQRSPHDKPAARGAARRRSIAAGIAAVFVALLAPTAPAQQPRDELRLPTVRDTWVSSYPGEEHANLGGADRLKLKGIQEMSLVDFDVTRVRGRHIESATLYVRTVSPRDPLKRVTVASVSTPWVEGQSTDYERVPGAASFKMAREGVAAWTQHGGDLTQASFGAGGSVWGFGDASPLGERGWQRIPVDPKVLAARVAGLSEGFVLFDDVGHEYERRGDRVSIDIFPNRYISSREENPDVGPWLVVNLAGADRKAPEKVRSIEVDTDRLPRGDAILRWTNPSDGRDGSGLLGYHVRVALDRGAAASRWAAMTRIPASMVEPAGKTGEPYELRLRGLAPPEGDVQTLRVAIRPVDAAGNLGEAAELRVTPSPGLTFELPDAGPEPFNARAGDEPLEFADSTFAVLDPLDKVHPVRARVIPDRGDDYLVANHLWHAPSRLIRLHSARNEHTGFILAMFGQPRSPVKMRLVNPDAPARSQPSVKLLRFGYVRDRDAGPLPDPLLPSSLPVVHGDRDPAPSIAVPDDDDDVDGQRAASVYFEFYTPHDAEAGVHRRELVLTCEDEQIRLAIDFHVWDFTLPDHLSFIPQMNSYGLPGPVEREVDWYRLAHEHRTVLNRLCYNWQGRPSDGFTPLATSDGYDWSRWDQRFGPLLNGTAFEDMPRRGVPVEAFYLPINENWPAPIEEGFTGGYWADEALTDAYRERFQEGVRAFAEHLESRNYHSTFFEFYLNNKMIHKGRDWNRSSAPWVFDEPVNTQDFFALRWYGKAFHEAKHRLAWNAKLVFRADISRPQWQRDLLDDVLDINVVGVRPEYAEMIRRRAEEHGQIVYEYAGAGPISSPNTHPVAWSIDIWATGGDGVIPWQTIGDRGSWRTADINALFYPGAEIGRDDVIPSVRLKAFRRGQQDVEYLTIWSTLVDAPRWAVRPLVRSELDLTAKFSQDDDEDAGRVGYSAVTAEDLWRLRVNLGAAIHAMRPGPRLRWRELETAERDPRRFETFEALRLPDAPAARD